VVTSAPVLRTAAVVLTLAIPAASAHGNPAGDVTSTSPAGTGAAIRFEADYEYDADSAAIAREHIGPDVDPLAPLPTRRELEFHQSRHQVTPRAELGIYRDLWVSFAAPIVLAAPLYWLVVVRWGVFAGPMSADSAPFESPSQALGEVLTGATNHNGAGWVLALLVILGAVSCFRQRSRRWLVAGHIVSGGLYVLAAGVPGATRRIFTGFWYTDSHRLAAMLPITGVPLAVIGVLAVVTALRGKLAPDGVARRLGPAAAPILAACALLLVTGGLHFSDHRNRVLAAYPKATPLVSPDEYALFTRIGRQTEPGTIVAQMPYNGSPAVMAVSRRQVLFPQLNLGRLTPDQVYLAQHLNQAATDPRVCEIVNRLQVRYLLSDHVAKGNMWDGTAYPAPSAGFRQIDQGGAFRLYRVSPCDRETDSR